MYVILWFSPLFEGINITIYEFRYLMLLITDRDISLYLSTL